ncbi:MAG: hypothetical protein K9W46_06165 [Candidatus Heimdallarchaeum endolithica]|uniref:Uncharacterized protein n=1 Tax=Candidatus Heimdallarchaeum endolithica TaxID=2876572 RepID=A0A9Y1BT48_9ARCH|nr:MAG: hypothetical protein K9W46_06165 [Candidatus Heimdallarchaeum endolithica]
MTEILWGYDVSSPSFKILWLGEEIFSVKQIFAGILFKDSGISGIIAKFSKLEKGTVAQIVLLVDDKSVIEKEFSVKENEVLFTIEKKVFPKRKVEIVLRLKNGKLGLFSTSVGTGMGFILRKSETKYYPSSNFSIGVLV